MSIFGDIWNKIVGAAPAAAATSEKPATGDAPSTETSTQSATPMSEVDVETILANMESQRGAEGNWRTSIVDLLKLLDLDSSFNARKELAQELNVHVGQDGSAEENIALHKAVMQKLEENGGKVPASLKG
jgi:hypothetical protein